MIQINNPRSADYPQTFRMAGKRRAAMTHRFAFLERLRPASSHRRRKPLYCAPPRFYLAELPTLRALTELAINLCLH
ncbi:hypothetical protein ACMGN5_004692 [Serratia marcescens]|uniref:hypothetical protein n=1 Tax=Serratia marcescens TaxID=615 RepID=UPI0015D7F173|nr:hypothetical protein [Serratia marcescens]QLJ67701.1 hypothetical protein HP437_22055 [Serratia marcescens]